MNKNQRAAFLIAQTVCAQAEIAAMQAENQYQTMYGGRLLYGQDAFLAIIDKYGIGHNAALAWLGED